jgi:hypothetical protein
MSRSADEVCQQIAENDKKQKTDCLRSFCDRYGVNETHTLPATDRQEPIQQKAE